MRFRFPEGPRGSSRSVKSLKLFRGHAVTERHASGDVTENIESILAERWRIEIENNVRVR